MKMQKAEFDRKLWSVILFENAKVISEHDLKRDMFDF